MAEKKYKVADLAKDLGKQNKEIIDLLAEGTDEPKKKATTALEAKDLDLFFNKLTLKNQVENFDRYFALANEVKEEPVKEEKAPAKEKKADAPEQENKKEDKKEDKKPVSEKPAESKPQQKKKEKNDKPMQSRTKGEARTINTRAEEVELDKYNERYENIAPADRHRSDSVSNKQKLKQKSQQYRKQQGMRSKKKETEKERMARLEAERAKRPQLVIKVPEEIVVSDLAALLKVTGAEVVKKLFQFGMMVNLNQTIDFDTAEIIATELGAKVEKEVVVTIEERIIDDSEDDETTLEPRCPVVVVMGHVDHGKTSILDAIRNTSVTAGEAGGITQHIGAYMVNINGEKITFLDTPGHAAFTSMRARGAKATDIAVLVVAADDGIMPQTVEAINHAKAADVSIIVAINKMDRPGANPDRIMQQLTEYEIIPEEWGGDTICVPVSAKMHQNIDKLLESILLIAEMKELKANPNRAAKGVVIEARLDKGRGPVATLLVQKGTLHDGDVIVAGTAVGRVRTMQNENGKKLKKAGPSVPVEITGLVEVPQAGDTFDAVSDEKLARTLVEQRKDELKEAKFNSVQKVTLDNLFDSIQQGGMKELNIIVKADVQGSAEAVKQNLEKLTNEEVRVRVIHNGVGAVNESDVMLAQASGALIVGFNVRPDAVAKQNAERDGVEIRTYRIIYDCIEEMEAAMKGMLDAKTREVVTGTVEVRNVIKISSVGNIAGSYVQDGKIQRGSKIRIIRDGIVIAEDEIASLRREKDDVKEVNSGYECGIGLNKYSDIKVGDVFEVYVIEEYRD